MRFRGAAASSLVLGLVLLVPGVGLGQTAPPVSCPPPPVAPAPYQPPAIPPSPTLPSCVNPTTMLGNCRKPIIDRYNADVAARNLLIQERNRGSQAYINALNDWSTSANHYGQCEVDRVNTGLPR